VTVWVGVDVGGRRKGFDVAILNEDKEIELAGRLTCADVAALVEVAGASVVAVDSPRSCAPDGLTCREGERLVAKSICGIRWTPDYNRVHASKYYEWIVEGLGLYRALAHLDVDVIEVFPTASWTRWYGKRGVERRSAWTRKALATLCLTGVPKRSNQDQRDAIAAAVTAQLYSVRKTEPMGDLVVPIDATS
jgi:predicted nuclease with RNAse H fold